MKNLKDIASILRRDSIKMTSEAGSGHPTSCLSCAEIISVLFFNEMSYDITNPNNPDNDEFVLSKGHAAPILYSALYRAGCIKDNLLSLRKINSRLEGHPIPRSLPWIKVATGSLGHGLGVGVGFALAAKLQNRKFRIYVLLGDSEIAEGSIYEAIELAVKNKLENLVAIIDINRLGQRGETILGHDIKSYKKRFRGFGAKIISIDGHNIKQIKRALKKARKSKIPTIILARTYKGYGVSFLNNKEGWHGKSIPIEDLERSLSEIPDLEMPKIKIKKPDKINYKSKKENISLRRYSESVSTRKVYGETLASLGNSNSDILALDAEVSNSTYSEELKKTKPQQFIECYIAEQNMVSMALGLSKKGFNTFSSSFAAFLSRAHDQIRMSALSSADMTFCGSHSGVSIGEDGASQMGLEDISMFRSLPNSYVFYPCDAVSTQKLTLLSSKLKGIKYIRTTKEKTPLIYDNLERFSLGDFKVLKKSNKDLAVLIGAGITTHEALNAYEKLKNKRKNVAVVDLYCIKPFNHKKLIDFVKKHGNKIVVAEDNRIEGGISEMISRGLNGSGIKIKSLSVEGIPHSGKTKELLKIHKIDSNAYINSLISF